jgi:DNA-binding MarR family transcriptional regulator
MSMEKELARYETLMERLMQTYKAHMIELCKCGDLTPPQFFALRTIRTLGKSKMSPLADELALSMGAASTLIDRLVSRGLVERTTDEHDRRAVYVSLTDKGEEVLRQAGEARRQTMRRVFQQMAPEARAQLLSGLDAHVEVWESLPVEPSAS